MGAFLSGGKGVVFRGEEGEVPGKRKEEEGICREVGKVSGGPQGAPAQPEPAAGGRRARPEGGLPCGPDPGFCTGWRRERAGQKRFRDGQTFCCAIKWGRISGPAGIFAEWSLDFYRINKQGRNIASIQTVVEQGLDFYHMNKQGRNVASTQTIVERGLDFYRMDKQGRNVVPAQGMSGA